MKSILVSRLILSLAALASASPAPAALDDRAAKCVCNVQCGAIGLVCVPVPDSKPCRNVCVRPVFCGGFAGIPCPDGKLQRCVDDPRDDCDPTAGGSDCGGLCIPANA